MLIVIYLLYVKLSETIHINRLLGGRHLFLLNKAEKSLSFSESLYFSIITLSTVGYGDIVPLSHVIKAIVSLQIVVSVMLLLFGFSEIMSFSRSKPSERK
ncbi:potassium channel family protein [Kiloniella sp.]|uniref:potassium channel family protein n=1 Tax=Kiloniella sp. TaxID=1938587 RepID=UPI003B0139D0